MAISSGNKILATDINSIINSIQTTYNRYGFSETASTVSNDTIANITQINTAIDKLNSSIGDSRDRRNYYYTGGKLATITQEALLSAGTIFTINTTNSNVYNDYCNCHSDCCNYDCGCDNDCCDYDCGCDSDCRCDYDCTCDSDCCKKDATLDCCATDSPICEIDCYCNTECICDIDCSCNKDCCNNDCCDYDCDCDSN